MFGRAAVLLSVVAACSPQVATSPAPTPAQPPDSGADAGSCPSGAHLDGQLCTSTLRIERAPEDVTPARDHHATAIVQVGDAAYLYVLGGTNAWKTVYDEVLRAQVRSDGSLGPFERIGKLPEPRAGHSVVVVENQIIVAGGHTMNAGGQMSTLDSTISAVVGDGGVLGAWTDGPSLPVPVMHHTCDAVGRFVYCIGGRVGHNYTGKLAVRMEVKPDRTLGAYEPLTPIARSLGFHQSFVHDGALYVAGGLHRDEPMTDFERPRTIWRLPIAEDGAAGAWENAGELPSSINAGAAQVLGDRVYFVGGQGEDDAPSSTVLAATLGKGRVSTAEPIGAKLSVARMHIHQIPLFAGHFYSVGGRDANGASLGLVDIGTFE